MKLLDSIERGNLLLPKMLYVFVLEQVDAGCFATATDFVAACVQSPVAAAKQTIAGRYRSRLARM
ncbi:MAG: hypothetical protein WBF93_14290 [Pirellulales bacterium]